MRKSLALLMAIAATSSFAKHFFHVCYCNLSNHSVGYNNGTGDKKSNNISKDNFKDRGTMIGGGIIEVEQNKCFMATDETIFLSHRLSFIVHNQLLSIVNPAFSKPYVISQNATTKSKGTIGNQIDGNGHEQYYLYVQIFNDKLQLSSNADPKNTSAVIEPAIK
ncbi:MAG: hypothetical protein K2P99_03365 [Burkholderiales bacterium]|nr:hypothetical protein [Burkholderiales bacterium]